MSQKHQKPRLQAENSYFSNLQQRPGSPEEFREHSEVLTAAFSIPATWDPRQQTCDCLAGWQTAFKYWCLGVFKTSSSFSYFSWLWICIWEWDPRETLASGTQQRWVATLCYLPLTEVGTGIKHELALLTVDCFFPPSPHLPVWSSGIKKTTLSLLGWGELIGKKNQTFNLSSSWSYSWVLFLGFFVVFFLISSFSYFSQIELFGKVKFIDF